MDPRTNGNDASGGAAFQTTHWTVVLEAARPGTEGTQDAFARIYLAYWYPLYSYIRRRGHSPPDAEDIAQNFFVHLIAKQSLAGMQRKGGKFRSFLLRSLDNFLVNEWDRAHAQKRGKGLQPLSLNALEAEANYALEPATGDTPATLFERQWVVALLAKVLEDLRAECAAGEKAALFDDLRLSIQGDRQGAVYADIASRHQMSEGAVKVAVHRLRHRYGELLRSEISRTVSCAEEVDEELRHFLSLSAP
jgi:RNA polymerase sigma-70 factor (ECF subfamily)